MLARLLKHKGNLLELLKMVHLFWVQNVQASFNQDLCCYFRHKGLKTIFTNLITCPKRLLVEYDKCNMLFFEIKQRVVFHSVASAQ